MDVRTNLSSRERLAEWQLHQAKVWEELDRMAFVFGEFATLGLYDHDATDA